MTKRLKGRVLSQLLKKWIKVAEFTINSLLTDEKKSKRSMRFISIVPNVATIVLERSIICVHGRSFVTFKLSAVECNSTAVVGTGNALGMLVLESVGGAGAVVVLPTAGSRRVHLSRASRTEPTFLFAVPAISTFVLTRISIPLKIT